MADFTITLERTAGPVPKDGLRITADGYSKEKLVVQRKPGSGLGNGKLVIETSAPLKVTPVEATLDPQGRAIVTVGPSEVGVKGDATLTIRAGSNQRDTVAVRFL
jgi:hypothetical protein